MNNTGSGRSLSSAAHSTMMPACNSSLALRQEGADASSTSQISSISPVNQFFCNVCFCPLMTLINASRASFVTSCGHFYCDQCAQSTFQGLMPTCKLCQCSSSNLTCMDLRKKQSDDIDVMISSNMRARKWFDEQMRQRSAEQMMAVLDQRNAFLSKQYDLCVMTVLKPADTMQNQVPFDKIAMFGNKMICEIKQASDSSYKLLTALSQPKARLTPQQQRFCQQAVERFKMSHTQGKL